MASSTKATLPDFGLSRVGVGRALRRVLGGGVACAFDEFITATGMARNLAQARRVAAMSRPRQLRPAP